jgi:hypothetical protein
MKKTSSKSRPLSLKRETVRVLAASQLESAQGGGFDYRLDLTGDDDRGSRCIVCQILPPPIHGGVSAGQTGDCGSLFTSISRVINP